MQADSKWVVKDNFPNTVPRLPDVINGHCFAFRPASSLAETGTRQPRLEEEGPQFVHLKI